MGILKFAWYGTFKKRPARCNQAAFQMNRELKHVWECFYDLVDHAHSSAIICTEMMWKPPLFDNVIGFWFFAHVPSMQKSVNVLLWWQACSLSKCNAANNGQFHRCLSIFLRVTLREFRNGKCLLRACTDPCNNTHYVPYDCVFQQSVKYLHFSILATLDPSTDLIICSLKYKNTMPR